jgi:hypothetical protein
MPPTHLWPAGLSPEWHWSCSHLFLYTSSCSVRRLRRRSCKKSHQHSPSIKSPLHLSSSIYWHKGLQSPPPPPEWQLLSPIVGPSLALVKYGVRSPKFIWAPMYNSPLPLHLGSYTRALLVSQDRRHLLVTPWTRVFLESLAALLSLFPQFNK